MRKLIWGLLLIPALCWGQHIVDFDKLWEINSTYRYDPDTCAAVLDTTAADSAIFYIGFGGKLSGEQSPMPTFILKMDSSGYAGLNVNWADSVNVRAYPRVPAHNDAQEADGARLVTLWNEGITLSLFGGTLCSNWAPTAERVYFLGHQAWWTGFGYYGITLTVGCAAKDAMYINRLGSMIPKY